MRSLSAADLLAIVEHGAGASPTAAVLAILAGAGDDEPAVDLAALPLGARDRRLLELRAQCLGGALHARTCCPGCGADLELALPADALLVDAPAAPQLAARCGTLALGFRLPTSADLLEIEACADEDEATRRLALRCIVSAERDGKPVDAAATAGCLDEAVLDALGAAMAAADPQADLSVALRCAGCDAVFETDLDVASFVTAELAAAARRLFADVHTLARGYGWSESDILAMSAWRRRAYVEMLAG
jgi:hypothetical protein